MPHARDFRGVGIITEFTHAANLALKSKLSSRANHRDCRHASKYIAHVARRPWPRWVWPAPEAVREVCASARNRRRMAAKRKIPPPKPVPNRRWPELRKAEQNAKYIAALAAYAAGTAPNPQTRGAFDRAQLAALTDANGPT